MTTKIVQGAKELGQECWCRTAGKGKPGQDSRERTVREDSRDGTERTGWPVYDRTEYLG
jgi:hypothetical protein